MIGRRCDGDSYVRRSRARSPAEVRPHEGHVVLLGDDNRVRVPCLVHSVTGRIDHHGLAGRTTPPVTRPVASTAAAAARRPRPRCIPGRSSSAAPACCVPSVHLPVQPAGLPAARRRQLSPPAEAHVASSKPTVGLGNVFGDPSYATAHAHDRRQRGYDANRSGVTARARRRSALSFGASRRLEPGDHTRGVDDAGAGRGPVSDIEVGPLLRIGSVRTTDRMTLVRGHQPVDHPKVAISGVTVAGKSATITAHGIEVGGHSLGLRAQHEAGPVGGRGPLARRGPHRPREQRTQLGRRRRDRLRDTGEERALHPQPVGRPAGSGPDPGCQLERHLPGRRPARGRRCRSRAVPGSRARCKLPPHDEGTNGRAPWRPRNRHGRRSGRRSPQVQRPTGCASRSGRCRTDPATPCRVLQGAQPDRPA